MIHVLAVEEQSFAITHKTRIVNFQALETVLDILDNQCLLSRNTVDTKIPRTWAG